MRKPEHLQDHEFILPEKFHPNTLGDVPKLPGEGPARPGRKKTAATQVEPKGNEAINSVYNLEEIWNKISSISKESPVSQDENIASGKSSQDFDAFSGVKTSLSAEMPQALKAYDKAVSLMRCIMTFAGERRVYTDGLESTVDDLIISLLRNHDDLLCLPRMLQRGNYLHTHSVNVAILLGAYYLQDGHGATEVKSAVLAGLFHDLGKALLPNALIGSRKNLTTTEVAIVKRHPALGHNLLCDAKTSLPSEVAMAALEHHERYDGSGYPNCLSGLNISKIGRLTAIADTYDAMSSRRPYKTALLPHHTLGVLYKNRDKHFHPDLLARFVRMIGIYPVGSIVELHDGYCGLITRSNPNNPLEPVVTLVLDSIGQNMPALECSLANNEAAGIARCLSPESTSIDPYHTIISSRKPSEGPDPFLGLFPNAK
jgi:HD-GYP domain-containing protein (c-di-GMP phosphodiesterase class II)